MRYLIVSHDAGGAEIVSSWVRRNPQHQYRFIVDGPALQIYKRKFSEFETRQFGDLHKLLNESDYILTGTSATADLERRAIRSARQMGKPVISFLDYWHGFRERFMFEGQDCYLPDEIWVGDRYALDIARNVFEEVQIRYVENPYLLDVREEACAIRSGMDTKETGNNGYRVLYLCQPFEETYTDASGSLYQVTDETMLRYFLAGLKKHRDTFPVGSLRIRLHPAEDPSKYDHCIGEFGGSIAVSISTGRSLVEDCVWSDYAVGAHTMALVVALACQTLAFHCIPAGCHPFMLPHKEITDFCMFITKHGEPGKMGICDNINGNRNGCI